MCNYVFKVIGVLRVKGSKTYNKIVKPLAREQSRIDDRAP